MNKAQLVLGQIGRPSKRRYSLNLLLTVSELPYTHWRTVGETSWRMGTGHAWGDFSRRARKSGAFTALRRFRRDEPEQGFFVQVGPLASVSDGVALLRAVGTSDGGMTYRGVERLDEREVDGLDVPYLDHSMAWEHHTKTGELTGYQRFIQGLAGSVAVCVAGSAFGDGWSWEDLVRIASAQALKVQNQLGDRLNT